MKNHSFMFLDADFPDISNFCMRMEKNIVEGDGVDAVIWAGKIAERVTHYITKFINKDMTHLDQKTKLNTLFNNGIIQKEIYDQLDSIRQYRNIATHHDLRNEMNVSRTVHRKVFNILRYFYGTYMGDESYFNMPYPGITYQHDESFLKQIKNNIYGSSAKGLQNAGLNSDKNSNGNISLYQHKADYNVHNIFNQGKVYFNEELNAYTAFFEYDDKKITIGHFKTREVAVKRGFNFVLGDDYKMFRHFNGCIIPDKKDNGEYSTSKGIDFDDEEKFWTASFDGHDLGYFISENTAIIARKEYIDTLPLPEPKNGFYSDYKEISFDKNHKLWYIKKDGEILEYYDSEREAIENLSKAFNLNIDLKDLGIVEDEYDGRWKIFYKNKYVTTCDTKSQAIKQRLRYISGFAQPKRNKDGLFSIHKGITYDDKNLIWVLTIKGERLGFFDSEADAFNYKKEFLKSKGVDVSNLQFHKEECFDENYDFKVKLNSDENAISYDEFTKEWIVFFRGMERGRCSSEDEAKKLRRSILKEMPYPPRKSNGKYSFVDGIDYDINRHLWLANYDDETIGYYDSEEDAFYGLKEALVRQGIDVSDMHFISSDGNEGDCSEDTSNLESESMEDSSSIASGTSDSGNRSNVLSYCDIFRTNTDNYILKETSADEDNSVNGDGDISIENESSSQSIIKSDNESSDVIADSGSDESSDVLIANSDEDESLGNIEEYKKSSFYGIAKRENQGKISYEFSPSDFDSDEDEEYSEDLDLDALNLNRDNGFSHISDDLFKNANRKDLKEIKFNSYDSKGFRREITLSYNETDLCISLEGMVNKDELKNILFLDLLDNMVKLNYVKEDSEYFSISVKLHYGLESIGLTDLIDVMSGLGWDFDLISYLGLSGDINLNSANGAANLNPTESQDIKLKNISGGNSLGSEGVASCGNSLESEGVASGGNSLGSEGVASNDNVQSNSFKDNLSLYDSVSQRSSLKEDLEEFNNAEKSSLKSKDYLSSGEVSNKKTYPKQAPTFTKGKKSKAKLQKAIIRGGVRVSSEEATELDNAKENKEIKSNIIDKKPEKVKEYKTYSLDSILEAQRAREEDVFYDDDLDNVSESSLNDDFDSEIYMDGLKEDESDSIYYGDVDSDEALDYDSSMGDVFDDDGSVLGGGDVFDDGSSALDASDLFMDDDSSFEDELESISSSNQILALEDETGNDKKSSEKSFNSLIETIKSKESEKRCSK